MFLNSTCNWFFNDFFTITDNVANYLNNKITLHTIWYDFNNLLKNYNTTICDNLNEHPVTHTNRVNSFLKIMFTSVLNLNPLDSCCLSEQCGSKFKKKLEHYDDFFLTLA